MANVESNEIPQSHWADQAAQEVIEQRKDKAQFVCASGISPSGVVHIGNFREVITVDFVVRALRDRGKKVRFIYSWDDYDALRKVPANLPKPEMIQENLRRPISALPDPFDQHPSYASHFEKRFEAEIDPLGIVPEFIYQNEQYRKGSYTEGIAFALKHQEQIREILNRSRTEPLPENWWCVTVYCSKCNRDTTDVTAFTPPYQIAYRCKACKADLKIDFSKEPGVKLLWRVDWPMRWNQEGVDFEPGGKDHSSQGGSYDTGCEIIRTIWKKEPPIYVQYDFVMAKGRGGKLSSSSGELITLSEAAEIYEPNVLRWIFASRKPNLDFSIAFDLDVLKAYDDFDRCERFAYGQEEGEEKKINYERRIYDLSLVKQETNPDRKKMPPQFHFRHLCNVLQIFEGDMNRAMTAYASQIQTESDKTRFKLRASRAWNWIAKYAPEEFKFLLRTTPYKTQYPEAIAAVVKLLKSKSDFGEDALANDIYQIMKGHQLDAKRFFPEVYRILIDKTNGPKLASFILTIGLDRSAQFFEKSL